jgi:hypothetical protein
MAIKEPESMYLGEPVFLLGYRDRQLMMPFVEPYVFIGVYSTSEATSKRWYFQGASDYLSAPISVARLPEARQEGLLGLTREGLETMARWDDLVAELAERLDEINQKRE